MAQIPCVEDSCSLDLEITDENKLTGAVILDPDGGLVCTQGEGVGINLGSAGCGIDALIDGANRLQLGLDFDQARGLGCDGNGLHVKLNPSACNAIGHTASGLYAPDHQYVWLSGGSITPAPGIVGVTGGLLSLGVNIDAFFAAYAGTGGAPPNATPGIEVSTRGTASYTNTTCRTMSMSVSYAVVPFHRQSNGWSIDAGAYQDVNAPSIGFASQAPFVQMNTSLTPFNTNGALGYGYIPRTYGTGGILLFPGQTITARVSCFLGVSNGPGQVPPFGNFTEFRFGASVVLYGETID